MLQACLNGARKASEHAALPITPAEIAADARLAWAAGAEALHIHPRGAMGEESLDAADIATTLQAVRAAVPDMPVGVATGAWIEPDPARRVAAIERWQVLPDYASVNLCEEGAPGVMAVLIAKGVGVEAGVWSVADAEAFVRLPVRNSVLRILLEMQEQDGAEAAATYRAARAVLERAGFDRAGTRVPVLLHGEGGSVWPMVSLAASEGLDTRVGLEDGLHLPNGTIARDNADIVAAARHVIAAVSNGEAQAPAVPASAGAAQSGGNVAPC